MMSNPKDSFRPFGAPSGTPFSSLQMGANTNPFVSSGEAEEATEPVEEPIVRDEPPAESAEQAHARGLAEGRTVAEAALKEQTNHLEALIGAIEQQREDLRNTVSQDIEQVLLATIRVLVGQEEVRQAHLSRSLAAMTERLFSARNVVVRVHPSQVELTEQTLRGKEGWRVEADPDLAESDCEARMEDAMVAARLEKVEAALKEEIVSWCQEMTKC